jgi:sigma-B regulation protein RsbU (phosphoserine phosphatase)
MPEDPDLQPRIAGLDIYSESYPGPDAARDYVGSIVHGAARCTLIVADVQSGGARAEMILRMLESAVRSFPVNEQSAVGLLRFLQRHIGPSVGPSSFVSALAAAFDMTTGSAEVSRAGHLPALHVRGEKVRLIDPPGVSISGALAQSFDIMLRPQALQLMAGDVLLLYTDGVIEASGPDDEPYGIARLERVLMSSRADARGIVRECFRDLREFTGRTQQTDAGTVLAVRVTDIHHHA